MGLKARRRVRSVLVVDDDRLLLNAIERDLGHRGLTVFPVESPDQALEVARVRKPDCAIVDLRIGDASGLELLQALKRELPELMVLVMSGHGEVASAVDAFHGGAVDFLQKPLGGRELVVAMERARERGRGQVSPTLAQAEHEHITRVLAECGGNISEAARRLGIHRRSLQRKLQKTPQ